MSPDLTDIGKRVLYALSALETDVTKSTFHEMIHRLKEKDLGLDLNFIEDLSFSPDLDRNLQSLVEEGFVESRYALSPRYTELYTQFYRLSKKGFEAVKELDLKSKDKRLITFYMKKMKKEAFAHFF